MHRACARRAGESRTERAATRESTWSVAIEAARGRTAIRFGMMRAGGAIVRLHAMVLTLALGLAPAARADSQAVREPDTVVVRSDTLHLRAVLYRPQGDGPFPAILFNH